MLVVITMIAFLLCRTQPIPLVTLWAITAATFLTIRLVVLKKIAKEPIANSKNKLYMVGFFSFLNGVAQGACLLFFNELPDIDRSILSMILLSLGAGSIGTSAGYQPLFWCYVSPLLLSLSAFWVLNINSGVDNFLATWVGLQMLVLVGTLATLGHDTFRFFSASVQSMADQQRLTNELSTALTQQETERQRAENSNQSKSRFLAAASHDLRQPVHILKLYSVALHSAKLPDESRAIVEEMNHAINSLGDQLNSLLDMSKLDSGIEVPNKIRLCLNTLINTITSDQKRIVENKGLTLEINLPENIWVKSDPVMLSQIIRNILGNAIKYTEHGKISITLLAQDNDASLTIADTGMGIEENQLNHIFEEFYQAGNPERDSEKGLGLGLSIVNRIATLLSHSIDIKSKPGTGTQVSISLPQVAPEIAVTSNPTPSALPPMTTEALWIHVVDDNEMVRSSMVCALQATGNRTTATSSTVETKKFLSNAGSPDLFLIDVRLRGNDSGLKTLDYVNAAHPTADIAFISGNPI